MKKLLMFSVLATMALGAYFGMNTTTTQKNDLLSQNIEALSEPESNPPATCTFNEVYVKSSRNLLICRGNGDLCCKK